MREKSTGEKNTVEKYTAEKSTEGKSTEGKNTEEENTEEKSTGEKNTEGKNIEKKKKIFHVLAAVIILAAACAGGMYYHYNLPEQRFNRFMEQADLNMENGEYEAAMAAYESALDIDSADQDARLGRIRALSLKADGLAGASDNPSKTKACEYYGQVISMAKEYGMTDGEGEEIADAAGVKISTLEEEIAGTYTSVDCEIVREDRSGTVMEPDGTQIPYLWYYDQVKVRDDYYPYAEKINSSLSAGMDAFFNAESNDPSEVLFRAADRQGDWQDYVGAAGIYSDGGFLSIRMAEVRVHGNTRSNYFRGQTFRLSDSESMTLPDLTDRTESSLRRMVRRRIWAFLEEEGYRNISKSDVRDYVESTAPEDYKFCIMEDGEICLIVDQEIPFFASADEILEIPLEDDPGGEGQ